MSAPSFLASQRTITASRDYTTNSSDELSLVAGETVWLVDDLDDIDDGREWVCCTARGEEGLVPRNCLNVTYGT